MKTITIKLACICGSAFVLALFLFYVMAWSISRDDDLSGLKKADDVIEFSLMKNKSKLQKKKRKLFEKKKVIKPPSFKQNKPMMSRFMAQNLAGLQMPDLLEGLNEGGMGDISEVTPIVRISPQYPAQAAMRGIEGWVLLQFDITEKGTVTNISILDSNPPRVFDKEAVRAVRKWRYRPKMEDGQPVSLFEIKTQLDFVLQK